MSYSLDDIRQIERTLLGLQNDLSNDISNSLNKTIRSVPDKTKKEPGQTVQDYIEKYAITLRAEEDKIKAKMQRYQEQFNKGTNILGSVPKGTILADKAVKVLENTENDDTKLMDTIVDYESKLHAKHLLLNTIAEGENLPKLENHEYRIWSWTPGVDGIRDNSLSNPVQNNSFSSQPKQSILRTKHMDLPIFEGDIEEWPAFYDIFKSTVVNDTEIQDVMKHNILRQHLRGAPFNLVKPYKSDGSDFKTALERLVKMYDSSEKQYDVYWNKLMKLPPARENPQSLRNMHNEVLAITNGLKPYGSIETQNFQSVIRTKIPRDILVEVLRTKPKDTTELLKNLDDIITIEESAQISKLTEREERSTFTAQQAKKNICKYCKRQNHNSFECRTFPTMLERKEFIKRNNLCFNCLNPGHRISECKSPQCRKCNTKHNSSICPKNQNLNRNQNQQSPQYHNFRNQETTNSFNPIQRRQYNEPNQGNQGSPQRQGYRNMTNNGWNQQTQYRNQGQQAPPSNRGHQGTNRNQGYKGQSTPNKNPNQNFQNKRVNGYQANSNETSLMVANAPILVNENVEVIPVLLDSGSDLSFVLADFAEKTNMKIIEKNVTMDITGFGKNQITIHSDRVEFEIILNSDTETTLKVEALTMPKITDLFDPINLSQEDRDFLEERNQKAINITKPETAVALIGCDPFWSLMTNEEKENLPSGRFMISTHLGPVICGRNGKQATAMHSLITKIKETPKENFTETSLEEFYELSNIGITDSKEPTNNQIIEQFQNTVEINPENKRIVVSLPWKEGQQEKLSNNKEVAFCRLKQNYLSNHKKDSWNKLIETFQKMEETDIIEEIDNDPNLGYFIPYGQVFNESSNTTKVRTVFDASSKRRGEISLNNALHQGPSLIPELQGILLRIRKGKYVLSGDIEKAFHAVEIHKKDRDFLRFILLKDPKSLPSTDNLRIMRFKRLPFGVNCSPYLLSMSIIHGIKNTNAPKELIESIENMCYVDNLFLTTDEIESLPKFYQQAKDSFQNINMNIREFSVNCPQNFIKIEDKANNVDNVKILGYIYDLEQDTMQVKNPKLNLDPTKRITKKKIVSEITTIFDPLQYFAPLYYQGKQIMRKISDHKIKWSDSVDLQIINETIAYRENIQKSPLKFSRHIPFDKDEPIDLAIFTDASETTYGACVYIKTKKPSQEGQFNIYLLIAKQRLAPNIKTLTIPRLELLAIYIGVRLAEYTVKELKHNIRKIEIFSDSTIALAQIKNHSTAKGEKQPVFVENRCRDLWNRLQKIKNDDENIEISLSHVLTDQNPADHITRGCDTEAELRETNYLGGPIWLQNDNHPEHPHKKNESILTVSSSDNNITNQTVMIAKQKPVIENNIIPLEKINNYDKSKQILALTLRFIRNQIYRKVSPEHQTILDQKIPELRLTETTGLITVNDVNQSEKLLIRKNQSDFKIIQNFKENRILSKTDGIVYQLFRINNMKKKPVVFTKSELARQIVQDIHNKNLHAGPATTLGIVLENFAGTGWKRTVKKVLKKCSTCRKNNNHSYPEVPPANLPERRTEECEPFQHAGVDVLGPIKTQKNSSSEIEKSWIVLFTCATTRLVHLELVRNQSTDEFMLALTRFIGRRGCPETITSDNASTFKLASEILRKHCIREADFLAELDLENLPDSESKNQTRILNEANKEMIKKSIKWYFNTALSPWQGGFFERLVGLVKKSLKHALGDEQYATKDLETIMIECESIVNRRPLTYVDEDNEDCKILRPIDLITPNLQYASFDEKGIQNEYEDIISKFKNVQQHVKRFWQVFHRDYLQQNKNFKFVPQSNRAFSNIKKPTIGEVVLLKDESSPRHSWKVGVITELMHGRDGEIRSVRVRTTLKKKRRDGTLPYKAAKTQEITRPLRLVIPLEISPPTESTNEKPSTPQQSANTSFCQIRTKTVSNSRIKRIASRHINAKLWHYLLLIICCFAAHVVTSDMMKLDEFNPTILNRTMPPRTMPVTTTTTMIVTTTRKKTTKPTTLPTTTTPEKIPTTTRKTVPPLTKSTTTAARTTTFPLTTRPTTTVTISTKTTEKPKTTTVGTTKVTQSPIEITPSKITKLVVTTISNVEKSFLTELVEKKEDSSEDRDHPFHDNIARELPPLENKRRSIVTTTSKPVTTKTSLPKTTKTSSPKLETTTSQKVNTIPSFHEPHDSYSRIECTPPGVNLIDEEHMTNHTNSVCTENWCDHHVVTREKITEVIIPPEFTLHKHTITWKKPNGRKFIVIEKNCPATEFCWKLNKHFDCIFCTKFIFNPQCHPKSTIVLVILLIAIPIKIALTCCQLGRIIKIMRLIWYWFKRFMRFISCCKKPEQEDIELQNWEIVPFQDDAPRTNRSIQTWKDRIKKTKRTKLRGRTTPSIKNRIRYQPQNVPRSRIYHISTVEENGEEVMRINRAPSRTPSPPITLLSIMTLILLIVPTIADICDETFPISHDEVTCNEHGICRIEKIEDLFFTPETKTICLQLISKTNVITKVKLKVVHNIRKCQKSPILYTKNVTVHVDSSKRCHGMGECVDRKCLDVGPNSKLSEFPEGNKYPGHTYCTSSCGGLWCKCLLPTEACLFYRIYAVPTTDDKFEIYSCEAWSNAIKFETIITVNNKNIEEAFLIREGENYLMNYVYEKDQRINITMKLLEISEESSLSILGKKFIQNNEKIALASITNEIFPLECDESSECKYRETCNCQAAESQALCDCKVPDLYKILDDKHHNLPVITERYHLSTTPDNVPILRMKHSKLHIQLKMEQNYQANVIESKVDCSIRSQTPYKGCYNCLKGASQNITCVSKEPTHAKLSCDNNAFIDVLTCDRSGIINEIHRKFETANPIGVCTVTCGNKSSTYKIEGKLIYVSHTSLVEYLGQVLHSEKSITEIHPWSIPDVGGILNTISKGAVSIVTSVILILLSGSLIYCCCMPIIIKLLSQGVRRY
ncbi:hypothetical protein B9Z55_003046 [Caenorhabditis nigoni]|uniref:Uncharacterized protein n=1 Tax=Caenorhabditis nigoni TaxID=1611254 RepID=A0A2G5VNC1_9PELO|nr:hypothetical protein B9Z55_003046 [Caenorhabditis nigoni]